MAESKLEKYFTSEQQKELQKAYKSGDLEQIDMLIEQKQKALKDTIFNVAVTGETGTGKSTLINAMRGLLVDDGEEALAAPTGVTETTLVPTPYPHFHFPNVVFWDLPGVGTPNFIAQDYLKDMNFECYDFFLIVSSCRFRENDAKLAQEIERMRKPFYFVRTKIDLDMYSLQKRRKNANQKEILEQIRADCVSNLQSAGMSQPQVFLLSSFEWENYDYDHLQKVLFEKLREIRKYDILNLEEHILNIAVTGETTAGKTSLISALLNMEGIDKGTPTTDVTPYEYPLISNIIFWDLPGVDTDSVNWQEYSKKVHLESYDFYIIVSGGPFSKNTETIVHEIKKMDKKFCFVRTKVDLEIMSSEKSEDSVLEGIRNDYVSSFDRSTACPTHIFLVSNYNQIKYDFLNLQVMLSENLQKIKKQTLLVAFVNENLREETKRPHRSFCSLM
ncbi:T-cell-specific guanine nucleotide triphosphate-binding protein 2-like [Protopterus annectens]|uniref:T-cell-specific guanine nucleotide triphosphate-binding protein 2-like n=1 Tax=Protopterus annectens TaxID=7888 RepID=UPI001CFB95D9|nr:T-cell-specific guanine nucleotide triphosphate-binding protein 2-like [Protopterus annectens]